MKTSLQSFDVDDVYRVLLIQCHLSIQFTVNPILMLYNLLAVNTDFGIWFYEVLGHLRTPYASVVLHAYCE